MPSSTCTPVVRIMARALFRNRSSRYRDRDMQVPVSAVATRPSPVSHAA